MLCQLISVTFSLRTLATFGAKSTQQHVQRAIVLLMIYKYPHPFLLDPPADKGIDKVRYFPGTHLVCIVVRNEGDVGKDSWENIYVDRIGRCSVTGESHHNADYVVVAQEDLSIPSNIHKSMRTKQYLLRVQLANARKIEKQNLFDAPTFEILQLVFVIELLSWFESISVCKNSDETACIDFP